MNYADVTITIPTFRRPEFVLRTLRYYLDNGYKGALIIGDSSDAPTRQRVREFLRETGMSRVTYCDCENIDVTDTLLLLMRQVSTKYVIFSGDDDVLVPSSVERCIDFLDHNPDYSCAGGRMVTYPTWGHHAGQDTHQGALADFWEYYLPSIEQEQASERLRYLSLHNPLITYSVFRTEQRAACFHFEHLAHKDPSLLTELVPNFYALISGKLKTFDHFHVFRQNGSHHLTNDYYASGGMEAIDRIMSPGFQDSLRYYLGFAPQQLALMEQTDLVSAQKSVKKQFEASCAAHLLFPAFNVHQEPLPWSADHEELRQCLRSVYGEFDRTFPAVDELPAGALPAGAPTAGTPTAGERRPRVLLVTQRWSEGVPEMGSSPSSWAEAESLLGCDRIDASVLYADQVWHDFGLSTDLYLARLMENSPLDAVIVSSQLRGNPLKPSTLSFLAHSDIPVAVLWDTPYAEPQRSYYQQCSHNVATVPGAQGELPNQVSLWPVVETRAFHDPGLPREIGAYCLGEPMEHPESLAQLYRLVAAGIDLEGIRDWRFEQFVRNGGSLDQAREFRGLLFDQDFYLGNHPVQLPPGMDAVTHYQQMGWQLNYNPNPLFDTAYYRSRHPDAEAEGNNPLRHLVSTAVQRCCSPHPYFNPLYYLARYPDAAGSGVHPLDHYLQVGVAQGRRGCAPLGKHELAGRLKRSRLALSFRGGSADPQDAARRSLEAMHCGALLLEPEESPLSRWFTPMVDYVPYRDADDLAGKVQHYLAREEERRQIAGAGSRKAARHYSGTAFWHTLCSHLLK